MRLRLVVALSFSACLSGSALAQGAPAAEPSAAEEYQRRIRQERLGVHYIPKDLPDAMRTLDGLIGAASRASYAEKEEDFAVRRLYFSFGRWLGANWSLYDGSRFSVYLRDMGIDRPDGQIEFVMRAYHRHLNGKPLGVKELAEGYKAERARVDSVRQARGVVVDSFTRAGEAPAGGLPPRG